MTHSQMVQTRRRKAAGKKRMLRLAKQADRLRREATLKTAPTGLSDMLGRQ